MERGGLVLSLFIFLFLITSISATETQMGVYQKGDCIELIQLCGDCTYNNITSIQYPNETKIILDVEMTKRGTEYNYTYCFPELNGEYNINGLGDLGGSPTVWAYRLTLTPNGDLPTTSKLFFHYGSIFILFLFFTFSVIWMIKVDDYKGKFALYWLSHLLLIAVSFMLWNGSINLLTSAPFVIGFFRIMFFFVLIAVFPMVILSMAWIFHMHLTCKTMMDLMERGVPEDEALDRVKRRKRQ